MGKPTVRSYSVGFIPGDKIPRVKKKKGPKVGVKRPLKGVLWRSHSHVSSERLLNGLSFTEVKLQEELSDGMIL